MRHFRGLVEADAVFLGTVTVLVVYLTLVPIGVMVLGSFQKGLPGAWTPATLENYARAFSEPSFYSAPLNAFVYSIGAGFVSFSLGTSARGGSALRPEDSVTDGLLEK